jgi:hypothetical protein
VGIVVVVVMERPMGKQTDNEENLKRYQSRIKELEKEGALTPPPNLPDDELIRFLAAEGAKLIAAEPKKPRVIPKEAVAKEKAKLEDVLGITSKNPYVRARVAVLRKYPEWRRNEIRDMEQSGNINNKKYAEFVHEVAVLGDQFSDKS